MMEVIARKLEVFGQPPSLNTSEGQCLKAKIRRRRACSCDKVSCCSLPQGSDNSWSNNVPEVVACQKHKSLLGYQVKKQLAILVEFPPMFALMASVKYEANKHKAQVPALTTFSNLLNVKACTQVRTTLASPFSPPNQCNVPSCRSAQLRNPYTKGLASDQ